ncbi:hypothetical protein ASPZODRAFT_116991 [Penicilliopsis zonata CBS 506.65]|uniref:histidine kinase n=1 Tax=Penicilliopsis zonata CBS 506.65 TaxID=1073090 RepID=A0A1L9SHB6_9EURO|nr:hypothetical protein ASPZODRAFT_116991 [Penicilliopsis zonata CBS 506.65]OJJ46476.1 hypothetical protein ASPZODRAFT_116991 [Penicilliopsis zonata CBS 506.65]
MISLFDRRQQYILAEATKTLSLQDDGVHLDGDALWLGTSVINRQDGVCQYVTDNTSLNAGKDSGCSEGDFAFVVPDLSKDDRFKDRSYVVNAPYLRFYAGVPIFSRRGITIGAFAVSDPRPRENGLDAHLLRFMKDTAATIMNHLEMVRHREQNRRGANMIAGLGSFVEGRAVYSESHHRRNNSNGTDDGTGSTGGYRHSRKGPSPLLPPASPYSKANSSPRESSSYPFPFVSDRTLLDIPSRISSSRATHKDDTLSAGRKTIFVRAANIIRESLEVEGVAFLDAGAGSYTDLEQNTDDRASDPESSGSGDINSGSEREGNNHTHSSATETDDAGNCTVLGMSVSSEHHTDSGDDLADQGSMRESLLKILLRNYPRGGIFNIDENGSISSSEGSDTAPGSTVTRDVIGRRQDGSQTFEQWSRHKRVKGSLKEENKAILKAFPRARSIALFPMWDTRRNRWFAGLFVWTTSSRIFSLSGEVAYLYAFSNSIMAEIDRFDVELSNKAKATLVSSISHELRSPLHGILGSTELLSDSSLTPSQHAMVHTIEHCGRTLLDIINNMLDFAKINDFLRKSRRSRRKKKNHLPARSQIPVPLGSKTTPVNGMINLISDVQLDMVLEEVVDSIFAGHCFYTGNTSRSSLLRIPEKAGDLSGDFVRTQSMPSFNESLTIIYEVDPGIEWIFETEAGSWRRILMNLFGNSMKYTREGYILVSLKASPVPQVSKQKGYHLADTPKTEMQRVTLVVKDTGQGIEKEYLKNGIFKPFSQENTLSPGSGLGLSIVHHTVHSMNGKIDITSTKGVGSEITVSIDLPFVGYSRVAGGDQTALAEIKEAKRKASGKSIGLVGFDSSAGVDSEARGLLRSSLTRLCQEQFGMHASVVSLTSNDPVPCDLYLVNRSELDLLDKFRRLPGTEDSHPPAPAIVICPTPQTSQQLSTRLDQPHKSGPIDKYITQPCGPGKLAKALLSVIQDQDQRPPASSEVGTEDRARPRVVTFDLKDDFAVAETVVQAKKAVDPVTITTVPIDDPSPGSSPPETVLVQQVQVASKPVPTVLLVDDNDVNLKLLVAFMKKAKLAYMTATNGLEALETFKANPNIIKVILMDISMPVMDGLEATREIRFFEKQYRDTNNAPKKPLEPAVIIALSGLGSAAVRQEATSCGFNLFLSKPVRFRDLLRQIEDYVK